TVNLIQTASMVDLNFVVLRCRSLDIVNPNSSFKISINGRFLWSAKSILESPLKIMGFSILGHEVPLQGCSEEKGLNGFNIYPSTKHATVALTHTVRRELAADRLPIKITSISPGLIKTNIAKEANFGNFFDKIPALEPEDIAEALLYALGTRPEVQ
ncbi:hypothetical protein PV325_011567, partial [Microctonus aethiopoides]